MKKKAWASLLVKCKSAKEMAVEPESECICMIWYKGSSPSFKHMKEFMLHINGCFTSDSQLHPNHTSYQEQRCQVDVTLQGITAEIQSCV